uniref:DNA-directed RNA polymerase subunit alpha n=1 Tax=Trachydiscus minutus TaxID=1032745 RepID=A0A0D3M5F9_9STRA|nr:DNA-directed RNA polymerase subunit alpha [Trachydiscus minutus]AIB04100.1 DNA-directed RNA polymerase subunit alpha [Trachydiscus minutus]
MSQLIMKIEKRFVDKKTGQIFFQFQLGPFKKTMATTVGVALRRVMMGNSKTVAITSAHGDLYQGNSLREDVFEFSLNLQQVVIKSNIFPFLGTARLQKKGPAIVTAADIILPQGLSLINPYHYLCTLNEGYTLNLALVLSSPTRTRFESGIPLRSATIINTTNQGNNNNESLPVNDLKRSINQRKKKAFNEDEKAPKKSVSLLTKDSPKSLPLDSILVDPIYAPIQSCSFEIINVVGSYFSEYMELTKSGLNQTPEYLRISIATNGSIEPVLAVQDAIQELYSALSLFLPLSYVFASSYNVTSSFDINNISNQQSKRFAKNYFDEICKKIDLINLNLPVEMELLLRRNGISTLGNIIKTPLLTFKNIGFTNKDFLELKQTISKFGFWKDISLANWEAI